MPNITYKSCYYLFILLPTKGLYSSHEDIFKWVPNIKLTPDLSHADWY